ncbi:MAG: hypothetical protein GX465_17585, partial [Acidobacteria bacterium]|nr:hypothetical protein [Acidobacteriota bacterium]
MMDKKALGEFREARDNWWGRLPGDAHEQGWWDALVRARDKFAEVRAAEATST